jgi:hypothetical protein
MGMFNWVKCELPLPDDGPQEAEFQTKSLGEKLMDNYRINPDGFLHIHKYDLADSGRWYRYVEDPLGQFGFSVEWLDSEPEGNDKADFSSVAYPESFRVNERWEPVKFTGKFNFYSSHKDSWYEYTATVENGKVIKLDPDHEKMRKVLSRENSAS